MYNIDLRIISRYDYVKIKIIPNDYCFQGLFILLFNDLIRY